ncbi:Bug family tripartite tricarboxylate transporter substrate binding protein [Noviherbaspirillum humi]|nr:tripartite tricarboxylate transporter substrate binding protein [Noviherbaspirillum humi]
MNRKTAFAPALMALGAALPLQAVAAWPEKPVQMVVPFGPGGANDLMARVAATGLSKRLGQPVIIENKPGAGAIVGAEYVAKSKPDGYTFLIGAAGVVTNSMLRAKMPYADSDLVPVGMIAVAPSVIVVNSDFPASNLKELIAQAKSRGKEGLTFATAGSGSTPHFVEEMLKEATAIPFVLVPFKSGQEGVNSVIGHNVDVTSEASIVVLPQVKAGRLKALATTYHKRISAYDQLPTAAEQGFPGVSIGHWAGVFAPKGTPQEVIDRMSRELQEVMKSKEAVDQLVPSGIEPAPGTTADFTAFLNKERTRLGALAKKANMKSE